MGDFIQDTLIKPTLVHTLHAEHGQHGPHMGRLLWIFQGGKGSGSRPGHRHQRPEQCRYQCQVRHAHKDEMMKEGSARHVEAKLLITAIPHYDNTTTYLRLAYLNSITHDL